MAAVTLNDKYGDFSPDAPVKKRKAFPPEPKANAKAFTKKDVYQATAAGIEAYKENGGNQSTMRNDELHDLIVNSKKGPDQALADATHSMVQETNGAPATAPSPTRDRPANSSEELPEVLQSRREVSPAIRAAVDRAQPQVGREDDIARLGDMPEYEMDAFSKLYNAIYNEGMHDVPEELPDFLAPKDKNGNRLKREADYDYAPITQFIDDEYGGNLAQTVRRPMDFDEKQMKLAQVERALAERRSKFGDDAKERKLKVEGLLLDTKKVEAAIDSDKERNATAAKSAQTDSDRLGHEKVRDYDKNEIDKREATVKEEALKLKEGAQDVSDWKPYKELTSGPGKRSVDNDVRSFNGDPAEYLATIRLEAAKLKGEHPNETTEAIMAAARSRVLKAYTEARRRKGEKAPNTGLLEP